MRPGIILAAALAILAAATASGDDPMPADVDLRASSTANLLVNGSFEEGIDVGEFVPLNEGSTAIKGWTVTRGQIDYVGTHWTAGEGKRSLDLHGSPGFGGVKQTFRTVQGQRYRVTFL